MEGPSEGYQLRRCCRDEDDHWSLPLLLPLLLEPHPLENSADAGLEEGELEDL